MLFKDVQDNYRQSPFIANLLTVAVLSVFCAKLIYYQSQQYSFTIILAPPKRTPTESLLMGLGDGFK